MPHRSYEELAAVLADAKTKVEIGGYYQHYRSPESRYTVLDVALQEDGEEPCVVYQTAHPSKLVWVRNLSDWLAAVDGVPRFTKI